MGRRVLQTLSRSTQQTMPGALKSRIFDSITIISHEESCQPTATISTIIINRYFYLMLVNVMFGVLFEWMACFYFYSFKTDTLVRDIDEDEFASSPSECWKNHQGCMSQKNIL